MPNTLRQQLRDNAYPGYVYGYPHKKAYRRLDRPRPLAGVWQEEDRGRLFCYVHVPFCRQRCSFCNLFTHVPTEESPVGAYLDALGREAAACAHALEPFGISRLYIGGGTPTYLGPAELLRLGRLLRDHLGVDPARTQGCIEASPETIDEDRLGVLRELGFQRLSLGVQSLVEEELRQVNRRFDFEATLRAIRLVERASFPMLNIDLIYGLPGQTEANWRATLQQAATTSATSLFLYPLYIRPLTGLDRRVDLLPCPTPLDMGRLYDVALEVLPPAGFRQVSMRQFRRDGAAEVGQEEHEYRCQRDGMVGLGAGARSYTTRLHYSTPWKMVARNIRAVIEDYCRRMEAGDTAVRHGFVLDEDERQRRFVIQSLLSEGLDLEDYRLTFGGCARERFAREWLALTEEACVLEEGGRIGLTPRGVRHADVVGQVFFSPRVRRLIEEYEYDR